MTATASGIPLYPQPFMIGEQCLQLLVPEEAAVKAVYEKGEIDFPFWSRVWPSAVVLANFIAQHPQLLQNKTVLEIGAGLGLPSFAAVNYAKHVTCTDVSTEAVSVAAASALLNGIHNLTAIVMDGTAVPPGMLTDILLLSDVNYELALFDGLQKTISWFLLNGSTVLLATPQRLTAKNFVASILPHCVLQKAIVVGAGVISILVLRKG